MAQYRQGGFDRFAVRSHDLQNHANGNGSLSLKDHVSIGIRAPHKQSRARRSARSDKKRRCSVGAVVVILSLALTVSVLAFTFLSRDKEINIYNSQDDEWKNDPDFLSNVTRTKRDRVLKFGQGSGTHGRDSRYWDRDDRRRDEGYNGDDSEHIGVVKGDSLTDSKRMGEKVQNHLPKGADRSSVGLYNEAGRDELKTYEAEYEASLKKVEQSNKEYVNGDQQSDDEYDDGIDFNDAFEDYGDNVHENADRSDVAKAHDDEDSRDSSDVINAGTNDKSITEEVEEASTDSFEGKINSEYSNSRHVIVVDDQSTRKASSEKLSTSKRKVKRRKFSGSSCQMKFLNSTALLVEPSESRKFARFSLKYTKVEENPDGEKNWKPRFAGHQTLQEREKSFVANDQTINCGFVRGPEEFPSTGFDLVEDDARILSSCHIAVISCIFGNSDRLRAPTGKTVTRLSRKNVCFVMFVDEITLQTLSSEGQTPDTLGFIGIWKIVVVKNLPYNDMRRVGKIPKFLPHRLFPSARYSIWLDSKLRLQLDPLLILEYFLWRKGYEYAISNHYDRHCVWEEVAQNKKLNKYNHTVIDQQFNFYRADGLRRFNSSDPKKLLPSNVPEGSFIVRAHTPMSNLFSCLWFNEVDRFTPRDQLSFAYTYHKLRRTNPDKPFHLNMFKDCERRVIAKLFRHRTEEKQNFSLTSN